jgi:phage terminase large subunit-like protein
MTTPGNVTDYEAIRAFIRDEIAPIYDVREIAYDRWNATQLITQLGEDGATCVPIGQGYASMSAPAKQFEALVLSGKIRHGGHPVLRWMAANVSVEQDAAGNIKPSKAKSADKIDGIVAAVMACNRATVATTPPPSVYDTRGVRFL